MAEKRQNFNFRECHLCILSQIEGSEDLLPSDRDRLTKILTLAIHPGTVATEAEAALHRARQIVVANPSLAYSPLPEPQQQSATKPETTYTIKITSVHPDWVLILIGLLSRRAYQLDLRYQVEFDLTQSRAGINVTCEGSQSACDRFNKSADWAVNYINDEIAKKQT
jgi:hypothetical protein